MNTRHIFPLLLATACLLAACDNKHDEPEVPETPAETAALTPEQQVKILGETALALIREVDADQVKTVADLAIKAVLGELDDTLSQLLEKV